MSRENTIGTLTFSGCDDNGSEIAMPGHKEDQYVSDDSEDFEHNDCTERFF